MPQPRRPPRNCARWGRLTCALRHERPCQSFCCDAFHRCPRGAYLNINDDGREGASPSSASAKSRAGARRRGAKAAEEAPRRAAALREYVLAQHAAQAMMPDLQMATANMAAAAAAAAAHTQMGMAACQAAAQAGGYWGAAQGWEASSRFTAVDLHAKAAEPEVADLPGLVVYK